MIFSFFITILSPKVGVHFTHQYGYIYLNTIKKNLYSLCPKLLDTFNKSLCPKLDDLFFSYPNLDLKIYIYI
jgi:hypothetical protein